MKSLHKLLCIVNESTDEVADWSWYPRRDRHVEFNAHAKDVKDYGQGGEFGETIKLTPQVYMHTANSPNAKHGSADMFHVKLTSKGKTTHSGTLLARPLEEFSNRPERYTYLRNQILLQNKHLDKREVDRHAIHLDKLIHSPKFDDYRLE